MIATFGLLALAIISLWFPNGAAGSQRRFSTPWFLLWITSLAGALLSGVMQPIGLVGLTLFIAAIFTFSQPDARRTVLLVSAVAIVALSVGFMLHRIPGFANPRVVDGLRFSPDALPFTLYLNYDKTLIGLFLLGWCHSRVTRLSEWRTMVRTAFPWSLGLIALLLALSVTVGYVRFDLKLPRETALWLGVNLLFTCVAEEALFRGFIQTQLERLIKSTTHGKLIPLFIASILFGLAHAAGGPKYVTLATIAGLGYGWIYQRTQRIEASILTHFALNAVHFLAFTYPALQAGR